MQHPQGVLCVLLCFAIVPVQYMMKYQDVKTKGGVDFAEHLVAYYRAKESYFMDGNTLLHALKSWESKFSKDITEVGGATWHDVYCYILY